MSRRYSFPDPDDRSKNNPKFVCDSDKVLGIYNNDVEADQRMQKVTKKVQDWFVNEAKAQGWSKAEFAGNQCILTNTKLIDK